MTRRHVREPIPDYPDSRSYDEYDPDRCPMCGDPDCEGCDTEYEPDYEGGERERMKPRNFPERINARRKNALAGLNPANSSRELEESQTLASRIVASARDVRTKKYRGAKRP